MKRISAGGAGGVGVRERGAAVALAALPRLQLESTPSPGTPVDVQRCIKNLGMILPHRACNLKEGRRSPPRAVRDPSTICMWWCESPSDIYRTGGLPAAVNVVAILHSSAVAFSTRHRPQDQSAADRVRHRAVYRHRDNSRFRSPTRPPGSFNGPEGGKSLFSFNRTSGSCWHCKLVCRVKASIAGAIWATPLFPRRNSRNRLPGR